MARKPIRTTIEEELLEKLKKEAFYRGRDMNDILEILLRKFFDGEVGIDSVISEKVSYYGEGNEELDDIKKSVLRVNYTLFEKYDLTVDKDISNMVNSFADAIVKMHEINSIRKTINSINEKMKTDIDVRNDIKELTNAIKRRNHISLDDVIIASIESKDGKNKIIK